MVLQGKGSYSNHKKLQNDKLPNRKSPTPLIGKISSLKKMDSKEQALDIMHDLAKIAAPIMNQYNFKVGLLCEMLPKNPNLLGLNVNYGEKICIRLRPNYNENWFLPMEELIETLLHELTHNKFGPHDSSFYKLFDELKDKYYQIKLNGSYSVTGYLSEQNSLGGSNKTNNIRDSRLKKLSKIKYISKVSKLGSNISSDDIDIIGKTPKQLMFEAAERRLKDSKICPSDQLQTNFIDLVPNDDELDIIELNEIQVLKIDSNDSTGKPTKPPQSTLKTEKTSKRSPPPFTFRIPLSKIPKSANKINSNNSINLKRPIIELLSDDDDEEKNEITETNQDIKRNTNKRKADSKGDVIVLD